MRMETNAIANLAEQYSDKPIVRSLLQLIPGWGIADTLLQQRVNEIRSERLKIFFNELADGKHELNEELIKSEDFLHSYFCTIKAVINTRQREKIRLLARLLDASIEADASSCPDEYEELLSVLDSISLREFKALVELFRLENKNPRGDSENELQNALGYWGHFRAHVIELIGVPESSFTAFMAKIERTGLYLRITGGYLDYAGDIGRTTELFRRLLQFVEEKSPNVLNQPTAVVG